jgi:hypothetical protein
MLVSPERQYSNTPVSICQRFLSKEQCDNIQHPPYPPNLDPADFYLVSSAEISIEGTALLLCYWHNYECDERAGKAFRNRLPGTFSTPLQSLAEEYICLRDLLGIKCYLTLSLLMSYVYGASCKARNFNVVYIWTYVWQRWKPSLSIYCILFQHWINAENFPVSQLCVNTLPATKITLITDGI